MLATDVLAEHHRLLHRLMREMAGTPDATERRRLMDALMTELQIHDRVEDELFYPAMADVSTVVPSLHAEQRQIVDQLSVLLRTPPTGARFDEELALLEARFQHHSFLEEETRMFPEVLRRVDHAELERMGNEMSAAMDRLRRSRWVRTRRRLKRALLRSL